MSRECFGSDQPDNVRDESRVCRFVVHTDIEAVSAPQRTMNVNRCKAQKLVAQRREKKYEMQKRAINAGSATGNRTRV
jgi:hypothetical protein